MAKVFSVSEPSNNAERIVFDELRKNLSNDFYLLNNRSFQDYVSGSLRDFEIDFIILSRQTGIMTVEVKGYNERDTKWFKRDENGSLVFKKDPFAQAKNNCYTFVKFLSKEYYNDVPLEWLKFSYCWTVVFPLENFRGLKNQHKNCIEKTDLNKNLQQTIVKLAGTTEGKNKDIEKLWQKLSQKIEFDSDYRLFVDSYNEKLIRQSEEQFKIFKKFDRGLISGRPGTGKTILAIQKAKQLADRGYKVLLVCHNRALGKYLKYVLNYGSAAASDNIRAEVWCDYMDRLLTDRNDEVAIQIGEKDYKYYHFILPERFMNIVQELEWRPTAVIVDEGQNFSKEPFRALQKYVVDYEKNPFVVFYDSEQNLYQGDVTERASDIFLNEFDKDKSESLNESYRLTKNIVEYLEHKFPDLGLMTFKEKLERHLSEAVGFHYDSNEDQYRIINKIISQLRAKKLTGKNVVILTYLSHSDERFHWRALNVDKMKTVIGPDENKILQDVDDDELLIYSVGRYIGLEAEAVILVDLPPESKIFGNAESEEAKKFILGATRSKLYLYCLFKKSEDN